MHEKEYDTILIMIFLHDIILWTTIDLSRITLQKRSQHFYFQI